MLKYKHMNKIHRQMGWQKIAVLVLAAMSLGLWARGQTLATLHSFTPSTTSDGSGPNGGLVLAGGTLYGTTPAGGSNYEGTVFMVNTDGSGYAVIHEFSAASYPSVGGGLGGGGLGGGGIISTGGGEGGGETVLTNYDGVRPNGGLVLADGVLYGTTQSGGTNGYGTVFALGTNGTGFTALHYFSAPAFTPTNADGINPSAGLILAGGTLYGTTRQGGTNGYGTVFAVTTNGANFTVLQAFDGLGVNTNFTYGNPDGAEPQTHLTLAGSTLYGTTASGGLNGGGIIFSVTTNGTDFTDLHDFSDSVDGANPNALTFAGGLLYGSTPYGGPGYAGTLFSISPAGTNFTLLQNLSYSGGYSPYADLVVTGNVIYGAMNSDSSDYSGTVFSLFTDGSSFTTLYTFSAAGFITDTNVDGRYPNGVLLSGNVLYGTANSGGFGGYGTVFSLGPVAGPAPVLNIAEAGTNVVLSWTALAAGFTLQSTTNLTGTPVWSTVSPSPAVVNGQNVVTNGAGGVAAFYRLEN